uniref:phosphatidyl-N-methylethanolamine N-methyltransferase n=1 Tax=Arcella intermedia TaxID=1963864 RepID=A0A6B2LM56_9EUKA
MIEYLLSVSWYLSVAFYAYLWHNPEKWMAWTAPGDPALVMSRASMAIRGVQYAAALGLAEWTVGWRYAGWVYAAALVAVVVGQVLNFRVYQLLGVDGVYYGVRYGKKVPWVTEWPYSFMRDPQYIGCIFTILGFSVWLPLHFTVNGVISYLVLIYLESEVPKPKTKSK